ncbi:hypothetical protein A5N81_06920 [Pseudomonas aeruginosa]|nr:hypothetical protein A5N81_06920 [Pseudomonas aeruginosa]
MWTCGLPRSRPGRRGAGFQVQQTPGEAQQPKELDQRRVAQAPCAAAMALALAVQQGRQVGGELRAVQARFGDGLTRQGSEQRQHRAAERRRGLAAGAARKPDAIGAILDALVQVCLPGDLARELRDVDAQPIGRVQAASMFQTSEIG